MSKALATTGRGGLPANLSKELAKFADQENSREKAAVGNYISTKGGHFSFQGAKLAEPLPVVVLNYSFDNAYYEGAYDADNPQPPICFALGMVESEMKPSPKSPKPQCDTCADCPQNKFGTADVGKGKACKNQRRLALLPYDGSQLKDAEPAFVRLSPTAVRPWAAYVQKATNVLRRPIFSLVTNLKIQEGPKGTGHTVVAELQKELTAKEVAVVMKRRPEIDQGLLSDYDVSNLGSGGGKAKGRKRIEVKSKKRGKKRGW